MRNRNKLYISREYFKITS